MSGILPIKPAIIDKIVYGAINSTHMIASQEGSLLTFALQLRIEFERSRRRTVELAEREQENIFEDPKKDPTTIGSYVIDTSNFNRSLFFSNRESNYPDSTMQQLFPRWFEAFVNY